MAETKKPNGRERDKNRERNGGSKPRVNLHPDTKRSIWGVALLGASIVLVLARFAEAGPIGAWTFKILGTLFGVGYLLLPLGLSAVAFLFLLSDRRQLVSVVFLGLTLLLLSVLGLVELFAPLSGGWLGRILAALAVPFGHTAAVVINAVILVISVLVTFNSPVRLKMPGWLKRIKLRPEPKPQTPTLTITEPSEAPGASSPKTAAPEARSEPAAEQKADLKKPAAEEASEAESGTSSAESRKGKDRILSAKFLAGYVPPPLSLLHSSVEKPTTGDLRANANIICRTFEGFGIAVEMGEINVGPKVTRYTMKPAEGVKLSRITALRQDLALALAAHPIRMEAPIPGKSLVGIEVPNKSAALVRLGSLLGYQEFAAAGSLAFALGRDVNGEPIFADVERMPHLLVAGATGSGKSILMHSILISLLYHCGPATLRLLMIDPKRVELSVYNGLPHLVHPVITENKKAIAVFRWAIEEMTRRYELLEAAGRRDIKSYNEKNAKEPLPYIVIVVDELADLMSSYGREVEGSVIRLAQMARATGIHLIVSTQRPSVEIITGLIKANITHRVALQVASQIDSRTILDTGGAETLLGGGDLLYTSPQLSKPKRIQGAFVTEEEIQAVANFVIEHNRVTPAEKVEIDLFSGGGSAFGGNGDAPGNGEANNGTSGLVLDEYLEDAEDEMYEPAVQLVAKTQKASASLLQRHLKLGYARAARLLDVMEERGVVGPGEGAKPREVFVSPPASAGQISGIDPEEKESYG
ncbi:MAG: DNA translocase FtsK [Candidatus Liptonbacteria bacterium]|nr:DNA translocase FtsK [Candidatus Liptonbacteria bacterium]